MSEANAVHNPVCLVTGASRGIGRAIALEIGRRGASVVGTATTQNGADVITSLLKEHGVTGHGAVLNVTDRANVEEVVKTVTSALGAPLILVNNAGITRDGLLLRMSEEDWDQIIETNLKSVYRLTKACLRGMTKARFGRVINITSVVGVSGNPGQTNYAAAKAGIIGFTKSLAQEVAGRGVTVNAIAPGFIETDMTQSLTDAQREQLIGRIPAGRLGTPEDIAKTAAFVASADAAYLTGVTLHVNGGMYMV